MFITNWSAHELLNIFKSGVCVKECPNGAGHKFKEGVNCYTPKSDKATKCNEITKTYDAVDMFDFCLPRKLSDLTKKE